MAKIPAECKTRIKPDHIIINKYSPGDGCRDHTDQSTWEGWVLGLSLGSGCIMNLKQNNKLAEVWLPPRSIYVLTKDARYCYTHGICFRTNDEVDGAIVHRTQRVSITFRNINECTLPNSVRSKIM